MSFKTLAVAVLASGALAWALKPMPRSAVAYLQGPRGETVPATVPVLWDGASYIPTESLQLPLLQVWAQLCGGVAYAKAIINNREFSFNGAGFVP